MADFDRMKMADTDTIDDFVGKLSSLASRTASLGETIEESKLVKKFLKSLPRKKFIHIIASLEQVLDLNTTTFEDIVGRLKAYEERICEEVKEEDQVQLLYSQNTQHSSFNNKAKGKGGRYGEGKEKNDGSNRNDGNKRKDRSKIICYRCEKAGHFASSCPEKVKKHEEANVAETQEEDVPLFMHEIVFLNEEKVNPSRLQAEDNIWYLDNGASNHMTGNRSYFTELNEKITGKVRFGDGSCVEITGKGSILFQGKNGDQRLMTEIYLIPELMTNILSLGQATESGCEVTMKDEYLRMHDGDGRLLVKVRRSANRLYKVALEIGRPISPSTISQNRECSKKIKTLRTDRGGESMSIEFKEFCESVDHGCDGPEYDGPEYDGQEHDGPNHEGPGYDGPNHDGPGFNGQDHEGPGYDGQDHDGPEHEGPEYDGPQLRRSTRHVNQPQWLKDFVLLAEEESERLLLMINGEPETYLEAEVSQEWIDAMKAEIESINKNDTWVLVDKPKDCKPIGLKWVYRIKRNADASINKHKARLVAKGYVQILGVDYEDGFAPVARIETIRLLVALAATNGWVIHHLDVKTAFLHGELKEIVYVVQPEGFVKQGEENKVYKLSKALYGLRQAPRAWNTKLDQVLKSLRFHRCTKEQSVYWFEEKGERLLVAVYVDDLFVTGSSIKLIDRFKAKMSDTFEMTDLGKLTYYLGLEVIQNSSGISIHQEGYADKILKDTNMESCNLTHIPMESGLKLSKAEGEEEIDATRYRRTIGCLRYLLHTRPDLSYSVGVLSRYMQNPKKSHGQAIKQVLRYLKGTKRQGLVFGRKGNKEIVGYSDSSHNIDPDDGRSTSGHIFYLGTSAITWCSQKQPTVALSSCEAEFMAATSAACQAIWLQELLSEVTGEGSKKVVLRVDNKSAIALTKNPVFHGRSKHILSRYHFIRECVEKEQIEVEHVPGTEQKADILTKALARVKFKEMKTLLGMQEIHVGIKGENVG